MPWASYSLALKMLLFLLDDQGKWFDPSQGGILVDAPK
jgi:hypothetical protein